MKTTITKIEIASIIVKLTQWLEINSPFHYMYIVVNNELNNYKAQLALMEEQNENEWDNKVPTEYYKQLEWIDDTARMIFY
ncbi:hypothetical protein [Empedobacter sp. GD03739]|uniref:hypothetical protein n=1 Tax=Empedobacter sp. GD03739 TaxID=2975376 RepID=UPI002449A973|nr:hypothetical protein [Empedobacter sp. GD03739]MDH1602595.1 hypothetical protein [Empedobacter sp. GD03739]